MDAVGTASLVNAWGNKLNNIRSHEGLVPSLLLVAAAVASVATAASHALLSTAVATLLASVAAAAAYSYVKAALAIVIKRLRNRMLYLLRRKDGRWPC